MADKKTRCYCEKSVIANCDICKEKAHISPSTGLCIVCLTGEVQDRLAEFILHDINCPETKHAQSQAREALQRKEGK